MTLTSLLVHLILDWADMLFREEGRQEGIGIFSGLASCLYYHVSEYRLHCYFHLRLVLIYDSDTWQLSCHLQVG